jgi:hypothetical protein
VVAQAEGPQPSRSPPVSAGEERPWAKGVPAERQAAALSLFREGNSALKESIFVKAATQYREALGLWDHPAIHYNLVLALLNLDKPVEVLEHLESAMKYGPSPIELEKFEQAKAYKVLVEKQLARVRIQCDLPGASVVMDGRALFLAPGKHEAFVRAGPHSIVATKDGYLTNEVSKSLPAGELTAFELKLYTAGDLTQYRRAWSVWVPWSVVGGGAALALGGGGLHYGASQRFKQFDSGIADCGGCVPDGVLTGSRANGNTLQKLAVGSYAVGGAALVTGALLVYMNRLLPYVGTASAETKPETVSVAPVVGAGTSGLSAEIRF